MAGKKNTPRVNPLAALVFPTPRTSAQVGGAADGGETVVLFAAGPNVGMALMVSKTDLNLQSAIDSGSVVADRSLDATGPNAPVNTALPVITGTAQVGQTLTVNPGTWTNSPTFTYQWLKNGATISGATAASYVIPAPDVAGRISCRVTATNSDGSVSATSNQTSQVLSAPPGNTTAPAISGTAQVGQTLTVSNGTWTGTGLSYARQWLRGGTNIAGATNATYVLQAADEGTLISCRVTATNTGGSTPVMTAVVGPIIAA